MIVSWWTTALRSQGDGLEAGKRFRRPYARSIMAAIINGSRKPSDEGSPRWSPDGRYLAFLADPGKGAIIYLIPPLGGAERKLVETGIPGLERLGAVSSALGAMPCSPDGQELLFSRLQPSGQIAIWKVSLVTGGQTQVTFPPPGVEDLLASWSFDGQQIVFARRQEGQPGLWTMPARGAEAKDAGIPRSASGWRW